MRRGCVNLIVVLLLIMLVVALLWARFVWPEAKKQGTSQTIYVIEEALEKFHEDESRYPPSVENRDLVLALVEGENRNESPYIEPTTVVVEDEEFVDFWKTPLRFELKEGKPAITSAGEDLAFDTADDITSDRVRRTIEQPSAAR